MGAGQEWAVLQPQRSLGARVAAAAVQIGGPAVLHRLGNAMSTIPFEITLICVLGCAPVRAASAAVQSVF